MIAFVKRLMVTLIIGSMGVLVGALIAPAKGEDTRQHLSALFEDRKQDVLRLFEKGQDVVGSVVGVFRGQVKAGSDRG